MARSVRRRSIARALSLALIGFVSLSIAEAQTGTTPPAPTRIRGTIDRVSDHSLEMTTQAGETLSLHLTDDLKVIGISPAKLSDIRTGAYIGSAAVSSADLNVLVAIEVTIFAEALRGSGNGHFAWDLGGQSTMTNGTIGEVTSSGGRVLTVETKDGNNKILVPDTVPVVAAAPAGRELLVPGAKILAIVGPGADGAPTAGRIVAGINGLKPPM